MLQESFKKIIEDKTEKLFQITQFMPLQINGERIDNDSLIIDIENNVFIYRDIVSNSYHIKTIDSIDEVIKENLNYKQEDYYR